MLYRAFHTLSLVILAVCLTSAVVFAQEAASNAPGLGLRLISPRGLGVADVSDPVESPRVAARPEPSPIIYAIRPLAVEPQTAEVDDQQSQPDTPPTELRDRITAVLQKFEDQRLNSRENSPWQVMHRVVAYGVDTQIEVGRSGGPKQSAIGWLLYNQPFRGQRILTTRGEQVYGVEGAGVQGHAGQLLAILAQSRLQRDYPIRVGSREFTVEDLIRSEQQTCRSGTELTFKLIGLSYYRPSDSTWTTPDGQTWSSERLVREEIAQRIQGGTCGGTHRLMGLTYAVVMRKQQGLEITGDFERASTYINEYIDYALKLRNPDGSFSTAFLERRAASPDPAARLRTTGHILEWLSFAVSEEALREQEFVDSVEYLTGLLESSPQRSWEIGPLGHALHGLSIYQQRVWGQPTAGSSTASAEQDTSLFFGESQ